MGDRRSDLRCLLAVRIRGGSSAGVELVETTISAPASACPWTVDAEGRDGEGVFPVWLYKLSSFVLGEADQIRGEVWYREPHGGWVRSLLCMNDGRSQTELVPRITPDSNGRHQ